MNSKQEKLTAECLEKKLAAGEKLTDKEWMFMAYSPFGRAGACSSCASGPVIERRRTESEQLSKEIKDWLGA